MTDTTATLLRSIWDRAVAAVDPRHCLAAHLPEPPPQGRVMVLGAGKAAASMAQAVESAWGAQLGNRLCGLVVTREGYGLPLHRLEVIEASHPTPDPRGQAAAARILSLAQGLNETDFCLALISGGGSALMALPAGQVTLADKQAITRALLAAGATIAEINTVRKHLSAIKGGRLAAAIYPAASLTLALSDVPGDDPSIIASGPTVPDPSLLIEARAVLYRYAIAIPPNVAAHLSNRANETPKPGHPAFDRAAFRMIARPADMLAAAVDAARGLGFEPILLGDAIEGEARMVAQQHAALAKGMAERGARAALISGGELTVTMRNTGQGQASGGPNREYALALAMALDGHPAIAALAGDTDGMDGSANGAGALVFPDTLARSRRNPAADLAAHDSGGFFADLGDMLVTGPTYTNANDLRVILTNP